MHAPRYRSAVIMFAKGMMALAKVVNSGHLLDCQKLDGQFLTGSCAMSPCTVAMGACCKPNDTCVVTSRDMCVMQSGRWNGRGTGCMPATLCCRADFDRNGTLAPGDIFEFLNAWFVGCP